MRIVLLGDLHLFRLWHWPWELFNKRIVGQMNLWMNRRHHFDMARLPGVIEKIESINPDMLLCSGDLTTTAHRAEFRMVTRKLGPLFEKYPTFISPGNHDRYTFASHRGRHMEKLLGDLTSEQWPHHRRISEHLHLIALDPTRANWLGAHGRLGKSQLAALEALLKQMGDDDRVIVLCHYTLGALPGALRPEAAGHAMTDAAELVQMLRRPQQMLFLHGHVHEPSCWRHTAAPNVVVVNAGAPLMVSPRWPAGQGLWEIDTGEFGGEVLWRLVHHAPPAPGSEGEWQGDIIDIPAEAGQVAAIPGRRA